MGREADVSIVVLCRSSPRVIERALASIARQTSRPAEIVLVSAYPGELEPELVANIARRHGARAVSGPISLASPLEAGFVATPQCQWVGFLRDVDEYHPAKLAISLATLEATRAELLATEVQTFSSSLPAAIDGDLRKVVGEDVLPEVVSDAFYGVRRSSISTLVLRRELLLPGFQPPFECDIEDDLLWIPRLFLRSRALCHLSSGRLTVHRPPEPAVDGKVPALARRQDWMVQDLLLCPEPDRLRRVLAAFVDSAAAASLSTEALMVAVASHAPTLANGHLAVELLRASLLFGPMPDVQARRSALAGAIQAEADMAASTSPPKLDREGALRAELTHVRRGWGVRLQNTLSRVQELGTASRRRGTLSQTRFECGSPTSDSVMEAGWGEPEGWGRWTDGPIAYLLLPACWPRRAVRLILRTHMVYPCGPQQGLAFMAVGLGDEVPVRFLPQGVVALPLPDSEGCLQISLRLAQYKTAKQDPVHDKRRLGVGLSWIVLEAR